MSNDISEVHEHMVGLGLGALAHANWHANYHSFENRYWPELSVLQAAHAAEILIKARIAQEHPLLIFDQLPKQPSDAKPLSRQQLVENGRTVQFVDLPDRLWATTGVSIPDLERYRAFGRLRNSIQHFNVPDEASPSLEAVRFIYGVIDPFINECWGLYAIDYNEDDEPHIYLAAELVRRGIRFLISPGVVENLEHIQLDWPKDDIAYRLDMEARFTAAKQAMSK